MKRDAMKRDLGFEPICSNARPSSASCTWPVPSLSIHRKTCVCVRALSHVLDRGRAVRGKAGEKLAEDGWGKGREGGRYLGSIWARST
eukprot:3940517-Rhodomonas_salina.1